MPSVGLIETLFGCLKRRGFDLEQSHLKHLDRLEKLFFVLALTLGWCVKLGIWRNDLKPIKAKKHGRKAKSLFRYGMEYLQGILADIGGNMTQFFHVIKFLSCT